VVRVLRGIGPQKVVKLLLFAPLSSVVVVVDPTVVEIADDRVVPTGQLDSETGEAAAEQAVRADRRRRHADPPARGLSRGGVFDLGLDSDGMRHIALLRMAGQVLLADRER